MDYEQIPLIPLPVVLWLEQQYPDKCPDADVSEREKCARAGEQRVVRLVRHHFDKQQEEGDTE